MSIHLVQEKIVHFNITVGSKIISKNITIKILDLSVNSNKALLRIKFPDGEERAIILRAGESLTEKITSQLDFDLTVENVFTDMDGKPTAKIKIVIPEGSEFQIIETATLKISSDPPKANVYINGEYKGTTPLTLEISPGNYTVKLTKSEYEEYIQTVEVQSGKITTISATLTPTFGYLTVSSIPSGAEVYVDNDRIGTTLIVQYKLPVEVHEVTLKKEGYKDYIKTVEIEPGKTTEVNAELEEKQTRTTSSNIPSGG